MSICSYLHETKTGKCVCASLHKCGLDCESHIKLHPGSVSLAFSAGTEPDTDVACEVKALLLIT